MGVLGGRDYYSHKYITAEIEGPAQELYIVPIKVTLGDYFIAEIKGFEYAFKIVPSRVKTKEDKQNLAKSYKVIWYSLDHYMPISGKDYKNIERVLSQNSLPKINKNLLNIFRYLGNREKDKFKPHSLQELVTQLAEHKEDYADQIRDLTNYIDHLNVDQIVTPVKRLGEFLQEDLIQTDPKFYGIVAESMERVEFEHKKFTNTTVGSKKGWIKIVAILCIVAMIAGVGIYVWQSGMLAKALPNFGPTTEDVMKKYPTPEALKAAIDRGEITLESLPKDIQDLVKQVKTPTVTP